MEGPLSRARRYFAPVRAEVGLYEVPNIEHRSCMRARILGLAGETSEGSMAAMNVACPKEDRFEGR